ncbi:MAG: hypothetical protein ACYDAC_03525 [Candidatus Dormibacteria bacterium]
MSLPPARPEALTAEQLPAGVRTARLVLWVQGIIGVFTGVLFILGNSSFAAALGIGGPAGTAVVVLAGVIVTAASGLVLYGATLLGSLNSRARRWMLAFEYISVALGLLTVPSDIWQASLRVVLAGVVIYYLQVDPGTRLAFGMSPELRRRGNP